MNNLDLTPLNPLPDGLIFMGWRGSVSHGTYQPPAEPTSIDDIDTIGVVIPEPKYYLGLQEWGSRGTKEVKKQNCDAVYYELRKMVGLLLQGNPNVLCTIWLPDHLVIRTSPEWEELRKHKQWFVGKHVFNAFYGYAQSQLKKMFATEGEFKGYMGDKRKQLVRQYGYDTKNAAHLLRLLRMGVEFLRDGELQVVRPDAEELIRIKRGEYPLAKVREESENAFKLLEETQTFSDLPEQPNYKAVENWLVETLSNRLNERNRP